MNGSLDYIPEKKGLFFRTLDFSESKTNELLGTILGKSVQIKNASKLTNLYHGPESSLFSNTKSVRFSLGQNLTESVRSLNTKNGTARLTDNHYEKNGVVMKQKSLSKELPDEKIELKQIEEFNIRFKPKKSLKRSITQNEEDLNPAPDRAWPNLFFSAEKVQNKISHSDLNPLHNKNPKRSRIPSADYKKIHISSSEIKKKRSHRSSPRNLVSEEIIVAPFVENKRRANVQDLKKILNFSSDPKIKNLSSEASTKSEHRNLVTISGNDGHRIIFPCLEEVNFSVINEEDSYMRKSSNSRMSESVKLKPILSSKPLNSELILPHQNLLNQNTLLSPKPKSKRGLRKQVKFEAKHIEHNVESFKHYNKYGVHRSGLSCCCSCRII